MEALMITLAVAVVPFIFLVATVILADIFTRQRKAYRLQMQRVTRHSFAAAANHKWL